MADSHALYNDGPAAGAQAPILIAHFEGAMDAGSAGTLAVVQLLRSLSAQRVATFDTDLLLDYRSHRPIMEVDEWVTTDISSPEIALDLVHDDAGTPILILHGPEPDARWNAFTDAINHLAGDAGVEAVFSFHGLPAAVPHTRPSSVHLQSTDRDVIPQQPLMGGQARFPSPLTAFLQFHLRKGGVTGITLLSTVPYYLSDSSFPRASSALLRRLADLADLQLPIGDLERGADEDASQVEQLLEINPDLQRTVQALEQHFDSLSEAAAEGAQIDGREEAAAFGEADDYLSTWESLNDKGTVEDANIPEAELLEDVEDESMADAIGEAIESYLKTRSKQKPPRDSRRYHDGGLTEENEREDSSATQARWTPKHRAPSAWEGQWNHPGDYDSSEDDGE